ncbi:hypothetical protein ACIQ6K_24730 [Streptomyces sp. NPDC096354]|uniref:hypothetical protein n=1 Tax=Streptomyces sp. NPDC096354 TaxID=3366088 RepID=UPI00381B597B
MDDVVAEAVLDSALQATLPKGRGEVAASVLRPRQAGDGLLEEQFARASGYR